MLDLDGFEGPLDLMLDLARRDKLDLRSISILDLADQYLAFIHAAQKLRLELAGDYLVMAAWLTYLKSRLLLPKKPDSNEPAAEELVQDLAERLKRLEVIRKAGELLGMRLAGSRETFPRGHIEGVVVEHRQAWEVSLHELVAAYAERRTQTVKSHYRIATRRTLSIPEARAILERLIGRAAEWCPLAVLLAAIRPSQAEPRSAKASAFVAALELARDGTLELKQEEAFAPLYLRRGRDPATAQPGEGRE
ncbi:MAG: Chromosome segregation and condensation protein [Beijerinckiaceae bacterium]|nr:MAG: Chromosome segregation and condensation protein [Beijerinckiaceae bacterium]